MEFHLHFMKYFFLTLQGDVGSGLVKTWNYKYGTKHYVIGVASHFYRLCGTEPDEYTDVQHYIEWIARIMSGSVDLHVTNVWGIQESTALTRPSVIKFAGSSANTSHL